MDDKKMQAGPQTTFSLLVHREFSLLSIARFLWVLSQQMFNLAISLLIFDRTGSALDLGMIGLASFLPGMILTFVSGPLADRVDRRRIAMVCLTIASVDCVATLAAGRHVEVAWYFAAVVVMGGARVFASPAFSALLPNVVPMSQLSRALAWSNSLIQIANISGPMVGGFLYAASSSAALGVCSGMFICSAVLVLAMRPRPPSPGRRVDFETLIAGYRFIWSRPVILGAISLDLVAVILGGAVALLPIYAIDIFHSGPTAVGVLRGANAVGALAAAAVMAVRPLGGKTGRLMFACVMIFGLATIGFGLSRSLVPAVCFLVVLGAADQVSVVIRQLLVQIQTPDEMRGRVSAAFSIITDASNQIGQFESGVAARLMGVVASVVFGGVGSVVAAALWIRWFPSLWAYDRLE